MKNRKMLLQVLLSIAFVFSLILPAVVIEASDDYSRPLECDVGDWTDIVQVAADLTQTVGLKSDGTVVAVGWGCHPKECEKQPYEVGDWTGMIEVAAGGVYTVGLKSDGTVVTVGDNYYGQCDISGWTDITQVAASGAHTVGLRSNGIVLVVGYNDYGQCNVGNWTDIVQVAAGGAHTVGLKSDGTVVAVGCARERDDFGQCNVGNWTDITQVAAGTYHTVGLKCDGTAVVVGRNDGGRCDVSNWTGITQVAADTYHTVGLKSDGTVVAVGCAGEFDDFGQCDVGNWTDITQVAAGTYHTVGLKLDGTVVAAGGYVSCSLPSGRCFIATAAYGTPTAGEIQILRKFRDQYLLTNPLGQTLVDLYYRVSPAIAGFITEHPVLKPVVRAGLAPTVAMSTVVINTTPVEKMIIIGLLGLVSVALVVWARKRIDTGPAHL
jgi:alpha-tubulin suppressor-like RCC1 family protein